MAKAPAKTPAQTTAAQADASAGTAAVKAFRAGLDAPTYVRLLDIGTVSGGVLLPVGKSLQVGVEIPVALAEARLAAKTAEVVQGSAITAQQLKAALTEMIRHMRGLGEVMLTAAEGASDADLLAVVEDFRGGASEESRQILDAVDEALARHRVAIEDEAALAPAPTDGGEPA